MNKITRRIACLSGAILLAATPLAAFVEPDGSNTLQERGYQSPDLYIGTAVVSATEFNGSQLQGLSSLESLGTQSSSAFVDPRSGRWATLLLKTPIIPGTANNLTWSSLADQAPRNDAAMSDIAWNAFYAWLEANAGALGIDINEVAAPGKTSVQRGGDLIHIYAARKVNGITVRDSYITAALNHGNLVLFGAIKWGDVLTGATPQVAFADAKQIINSHLGNQASRVNWYKQNLVYVPVANGKDPRQVQIGNGYGYRLAWSLRGTQPGDLSEWEALVDANSPELLAFVDRANYASTREVEGGVLPISNDGMIPDGIEHTYPMPFLNVDNAGDELTTDRGGNLPACVDGTISAELVGPYVTMNDNCGAILESITGPVLDFGQSAGTDCATPPGASVGNTHASRTGFYELNRSMAIGRSYVPSNAFLNSQLTANMNINLNCNATSGGPVVNFYRSGGGCANTGELAGVFVHEWGHSVDIADAVPGIASPGEGIADIYASHNLHTSCMGRNFQGGNCNGYGDPCTQCSGVRDIDWANRASNTPHTLDWIDANCLPPTQGAPGPCGGRVHCEGAVYAEAVWDLWHRDLTAAPYNYDSIRASELAALLTWGGATNVGVWFSCTNGSGGDGCNADGGYLNYLAADDDDGDLTNGTPHMGAIFSAYDRHGIACPTPTNQDSGCASPPTTAPTLTTMPIDRGMQLSWTAVPNATTYRVFRAEGVLACDFGKELIAETAGLTFTDQNLKNAFDYHYSVLAVGATDTCYGPASSCVTAQAASGANLALSPAPSAPINITTGDGDAFVDSCEMATVSFDVDNIGSVTSFGVRVVDVRSPSHPHLDSTVTFGDVIDDGILAGCERATGSFSFAAFDVAPGDVITFEVDVTSNQLAGVVVTRTYSIPAVESDLQTFPTITYTFEGDTEGWTTTEGTFNRTDAFGGGDTTSFGIASSNGVDSVCDKSRSPLFIPSASTTMSLWTELNMETGNWDRANASIVDASGTRTVIAPDGGRAYNTSGNPQYAACNEGEDGWGAVLNTWASSSFSAAALGSAGLAGDLVQIEMTHATDVAEVGTGFRFDQVTLTDVDVQVADTQPNCATAPPLFEDGFESGNTIEWFGAFP